MPAKVLKSALKALMARTPYRIVRHNENRFQSIPHSLATLARFGYSPRLIIDGGAHVGEFSTLCAGLWPQAEIHMIEPQPACQTQLAALPYKLHPVALSATVGEIEMMSSDAPHTGVMVWPGGGQTVPMATLDSLFTLNPADRALLKMDLQGHEIEALKGAAGALPAIEVILCEIAFFGQHGEPLAAELVRYLDDRGFLLFDIASLSGRPRDDRLQAGDFLFVRKDSPLVGDSSWA